MYNYQTCQYTLLLCFIGMLLFSCERGTGWAEELSHDFPRTEEEIVKTLQRKGIHRKGPKAVVDDYSSLLQENPSARAFIHFDFDSAAIKPESYSLLQEYGKALQHGLKDAVLIIAGHTDSVGTETYNMKLSRHRAEAVKTFLVSHYQIDADRLLVQAYGENQPITSNTTKEGRSLNRRVEFINIQ
jgi:outer membrane protein OmpA-like peptidoglycan-associated protein